MRKPHLPYGLHRPKLRQSWNKYNFFNMYRQVGREPMIRGTPTFFQQKWAAKSKTRAYHGEHIPEKKWKRLFSRRLMSAVDMPPQYLAAHDGSEQAAGRGSGLATSSVTAESFSRVPKPSSHEKRKRHSVFGDVNKLLSDQFHNITPYMQMTFAPLERRLDTAVFRALFASSVRQARQFIIHGGVQVNGHKMIHPSYQLNPGDMFQVDIEKVMFGTGHPKKSKRDMQMRGLLDARRKTVDEFTRTSTTTEVVEDKAAEEETTAKAESSAQEDAAAMSEEAADVSAEPLSPEESWKQNEKALKFILKRVRRVLQTSPKDLSATDKKRLRIFRDEAKRFLARPDDSDIDAQELMEELQLQMKSHEMMRDSFGQLSLNDSAKSPDADAEEASVEADAGASTEPEHNRQRQIDKGLEGLSEEQKEKAMRIMGESQLSRDEMRKLARLLQSDEENPVDDTKPYATPWRPRAYMSAFAYIPRYLEVNPNICAAVYLRHPVARKGMAEVPTPFAYLTNQLTHNWYLERG